MLMAKVGKYQRAETIYINAILNANDATKKHILLNNLTYVYLWQDFVGSAGITSSKGNYFSKESDLSISVPFIIGTAPIVKAGICKTNNGGSPPFNPDPATDGSMAYCDGLGGLEDGFEDDFGDDGSGEGGDSGGGTVGGSGGVSTDGDSGGNGIDLDRWKRSCGEIFGTHYSIGFNASQSLSSCIHRVTGNLCGMIVLECSAGGGYPSKACMSRVVAETNQQTVSRLESCVLLDLVFA